MNEPEQIEFTAPPPFPAPKWARTTAFVGVYALVLAGMVELQQSVQALLAWFGLDSSGLDRIGLLAGLYIAFMGLRPLLYQSMERNVGLYLMAWSLVSALSALAAAAVAAVAIQLAARDFADSFTGGITPTLAACVTLAIGWAATAYATRRRERRAEEAGEMEGGAG
ncbi:MAG: hypothetical protein OEZ03_16385 [Alphaproteobacteria bacterium]|nr:hypothetical protein [Alphaproteobacteria bacterium]